MEEKIIIYLQENIYATLKKDAELFEFYKNNGDLNMNQFCNKLICNYFDTYQKNLTILNSKICKLITNEINISDFEANQMSNGIINEFSNISHHTKKVKTDIKLSLKPTKTTANTIDYIKDQFLSFSSLSGYFRNMFISYASISRDKRERIIFKENIDKLENSIKNKQQIYIKNNNGNSFIGNPYCIASSKDEFFNYLIVEVNEKIKSFRVSRLDTIIERKEKFNYKKEYDPIIQKMIVYGPQYILTKSDSKLIKIRLSEKGIKMYKSIYTYRPTFIKKENDIFYFDCSLAQAKQYFLRFGEEAEIIEPSNLRNEFKDHYKKSLKLYE